VGGKGGEGASQGKATSNKDAFAVRGVWL